MLMNILMEAVKESGASDQSEFLTLPANFQLQGLLLHHPFSYFTLSLFCKSFDFVGKAGNELYDKSQRIKPHIGKSWERKVANWKSRNRSIGKCCIIIQWKHCINSPGSCFVRRDLLLFGPRADPPLSVPLIITFASAAGDTDMFLYWGTFLDLCFIGYDATKSTFAFFRISLLQTFYYQSLQMYVKIFVFCICNLFDKLQAQMCVFWTITKTAKLVPSRLWMS